MQAPNAAKAEGQHSAMASSRKPRAAKGLEGLFASLLSKVSDQAGKDSKAARALSADPKNARPDPPRRTPRKRLRQGRAPEPPPVRSEAAPASVSPAVQRGRTRSTSTRAAAAKAVDPDSARPQKRRKAALPRKHGSAPGRTNGARKASFPRWFHPFGRRLAARKPGPRTNPNRWKAWGARIPRSAKPALPWWTFASAWTRRPRPPRRNAWKPCPGTGRTPGSAPGIPPRARPRPPRAVKRVRPGPARPPSRTRSRRASTSSITATSSKAAQIVLKDGDAGLIRLRLEPETLGGVKIELKLTEKHISGTIVVESDEAKSAFEGNMNALPTPSRERLRDDEPLGRGARRRSAGLRGTAGRRAGAVLLRAPAGARALRARWRRRRAALPGRARSTCLSEHEGGMTMNINTQLSPADLAQTKFDVEAFNKDLKAQNQGRSVKTELDKDDFLKILITQLQHQDPTAPMRGQGIHRPDGAVLLPRADDEHERELRQALRPPRLERGRSPCSARPSRSWTASEPS